jgi:hypothetical protein
LSDDEEENLSISDLTFSGAESGRKVGYALIGVATTTDDQHFLSIVLGDNDAEDFMLSIARIHPEPFNFAPGSHTLNPPEEGGDPLTNLTASLTMLGASNNTIYAPYGADTGGTFSIDRIRTIGEREYIEGNVSLTLAALMDASDRVSVEGTFKGFVEDLGVIDLDDDD